ncbi:hypothetical protein IAR55_000180 [Kwoniella newhampshirensis]|uniref:Zn(2)-C6 fungal-type domain-containing protein n=1 Tax=Kwoniella newhampshirensis TaxID=1651941 RepID=A0AAW0Z5X1_9TREE
MPPLPSTASRKQNIACDQCRTKKIRCLRTDKTEICEQCDAKGTGCTSHYIESLAQSKSKRTRKAPNTTDKDAERSTSPPSKRRRRKSDTSERRELDHSTSRSETELGIAAEPISTYEIGESSQRRSFDVGQEGLVDSLHLLAQLAPSQPATTSSTATVARAPAVPTLEDKQNRLIRYLLSPYPVTTLEYGYTDLAGIESCEARQDDIWEEENGRIWAESPSEAHLTLIQGSTKELADQLLETFFSICHPRYPCYDLTTFRARFQSPNTHPDGPLSHTVLAVALAWGARFSDHPIISHDRQECSARDGDVARRGRTRSRLVGLMVIRAREVAETCKAFRAPKLENVQALMILEGLLGQYRPRCISAAVEHLIVMGYNTAAGLMKIQDSKMRSEAISIWWVLVISDGFRSVFHRLKPCLYDEDYNIKPPDAPINAEPDRQQINGFSFGVADDTEAWFAAAHAGASMCRALCKSLWIPQTSETGIPLSTLRDFIHQASQLRGDFVSRLGVPSKWPEEWDFIQAMTACATDSFWHCLWLVVDRAIVEFGVKEEKSGVGGGWMLEVDNVKRRIREESEHAALRITALVAVLTEAGYMRLDPLICHHPVYEAGRYLASQGRVESLACVAGLKQYSTTFPAMWTQAEEVERIYEMNKSQPLSPQYMPTMSTRPGDFETTTRPTLDHTGSSEHSQTTLNNISSDRTPVQDQNKQTGLKTPPYFSQLMRPDENPFTRESQNAETNVPATTSGDTPNIPDIDAILKQVLPERPSVLPPSTSAQVARHNERPQNDPVVTRVEHIDSATGAFSWFHPYNF